MRLVRVEWNDACGINEWESVDDMITRVKKEFFDPVITIGWIIFEDDRIMVLAQTVTGFTPGVERRVNNVECIPRGMIRRVHEIAAEDLPPCS